MEDSKAFRVTTGHEVVKREIAKHLRRQMTVAEARLWQNLRANRLANLRFRRQQILEGFIVDFYCHTYRLAIEVDGGIHEHQREYDEDRTRILSKLGIRILRFTNSEVEHSLADVLKVIYRATQSPMQSSAPFQPLRGEASLSERGEQFCDTILSTLTPRTRPSTP